MSKFPRIVLPGPKRAVVVTETPGLARRFSSKGSVTGYQGRADRFSVELRARRLRPAVSRVRRVPGGGIWRSSRRNSDGFGRNSGRVFPKRKEPRRFRSFFGPHESRGGVCPIQERVSGLPEDRFRHQLVEGRRACDQACLGRCVRDRRQGEKARRPGACYWRHERRFPSRVFRRWGALTTSFVKLLVWTAMKGYKSTSRSPLVVSNTQGSVH